jgi:GNAT superfamily N-acetyltransferase
MDEQVVNDLFERAVSNGYSKSREEFITLLHNDNEVFNDMYSYVKSKGYQKSEQDFSSLIGKGSVASKQSTAPKAPLKKKESTNMDSPLGVSSSELPIQPQSDLNPFAKNMVGIPQDAPKKVIQEEEIQTPTTKQPSEFTDSYFKGDFGNILKAIDAPGSSVFSSAGIGHFIDNIGRAINQGSNQGDVVTPASKMMLSGPGTDSETIKKYYKAAMAMGDIQPSNEAKLFAKVYKDNGENTFAFFKALKEAPASIPEVLVSSFASMVNPSSAAAAGTIIGGSAAVGAVASPYVAGAGAIPTALASIPYAMGAASMTLETGLTFSELLQEELTKKGLEFNEKNIKTILEDDKILTSIRTKSLARGATIGMIDAMTGRLAGSVGAKLLGSTVSSRIKSAAASSAIEMAGGSAGEATARAVIGQKMDAAEIGLEGIATAPMAIPNVVAEALRTPSYKINGEKVTEAQAKAIVDNATPSDLSKIKFDIKNDKLGLNEIIQKKVVANQIKEEVIKASPKLNETSVDAITDLELELQKFEGNKTQSAKDKAASIRQEIKKIQETPLADKEETKNAIQKQSTDESVLLSEQPEVGLPKVGEGDTESKVATERTKKENPFERSKQEIERVKLVDNVIETNNRLAKDSDTDAAIEKYNQAKKALEDFDKSVEQEKDKKRAQSNVSSIIEDENDRAQKSNYEYKDLYEEDPRLAAIQDRREMLDFIKTEDYRKELIKMGENPDNIESGIEKSTKTYQQDIADLESDIQSNPIVSSKTQEGDVSSVKSDNFFNKMDEVFPNDHLGGGYAATDADGNLLGRIKMSQIDDNTVKIDEVVSEKKGQRTGNGSKIMNIITKIADENNVKIILTPNIIGEMKVKGFDTPQKLRDFYSKFGFEKNSKNNMMERNPSVSPLVEEIAAQPIVEDIAVPEVEVEQYIPITEKEISHEKFTKDNAVDYETDFKTGDNGREYEYISRISVEATNDNGDSVGNLVKMIDEDGNVSWNAEDVDGNELSEDGFDSKIEAQKSLVDKWNKIQKKEFEKEIKRQSKIIEKETAKKAKAAEKAAAKTAKPIATKPTATKDISVSEEPTAKDLSQIDAMLDLDMEDEDNMLMVLNALDKADKAISKRLRTSANDALLAIPLSTVQAIIKAVKVLVKGGMLLRDAIKKVASENNVSDKTVINILDKVKDESTQSKLSVEDTYKKYHVAPQSGHTKINVKGNEPIKKGETFGTVTYSNKEEGDVVVDSFSINDIDKLSNRSSGFITTAKNIAQGFISIKPSPKNITEQLFGKGKNYKNLSDANKTKVDKERIKQTTQFKLPWSNSKAIASLNTYINKNKDNKPSDYYNVVKQKSKDIINSFKEEVKNNLRALYNNVSEDFKEISKQWYDGANRLAQDISKSYNISLEQSAGILAALSPKNNWFNNISAAERVIRAWSDHQTTIVTQEMVDRTIAYMERNGEAPFAKDILAVFSDTKGASISELVDEYKKTNDAKILTQIGITMRIIDQSEYSPIVYSVSPEGFIDGKYGVIGWSGGAALTNAVSILIDPSMKNISSRLGNGNKVRNFYGNIIDPQNAEFLTADTHAFAAGLMLPASANEAQDFGLFDGGMSVEYAIFKDAYIEVAKEFDILPRELQSITWEAVRGSINTDNRTPSMVKDINKISEELLTNGESNENRTNEILKKYPIKFSKGEWSNKRGIEAQKRIFGSNAGVSQTTDTGRSTTVSEDLRGQDTKLGGETSITESKYQKIKDTFFGGLDANKNRLFFTDLSSIAEMRGDSRADVAMMFDGATFWLSESNDGYVIIDDFQVNPDKLGQGKGSESLKTLTEFADKNGITLIGEPLAQVERRAGVQKGLTQNQLNEFYKKNGFTKISKDTLAKNKYAEENFLERIPEISDKIQSIDNVLDLDVKDKNNLESVLNFLDNVDKSLSKRLFGSANDALLAIPLSTVQLVVKTLKVLVKGGMVLRDAIKKVSADNNISQESVKDIINISPIQEGFNELMAKVDKMIERQTSRGTNKKRMTMNVDTFVRNSEVYQAADDAQKKIMEREARAKMGVDQRKAPSIGRILGKLKDITNVSRQDKLKIISQIRELSKDAAKDLAKEIRNLSSQGKISLNQASSIVSKFGKVNMLSEISVSRFVDYMTKVFADAEYANQVSIANSTRKDIKKLSKDTTRNANVRVLAKSFSNIDPSLVDDIYKYNKYAQAIKEGIKGSKVIGENLKLAETVSISEVSEYVNDEIKSQDKKIRAEKISEIQELMGIDASEMSAEELDIIMESKEPTTEYKETIIKDALKKAFNVYSSLISEMLKTGYDAFYTGEKLNLTKNEIELVKKFMEMNLNVLSTKQSIRAIDALANFIQNNSIAGMSAALDSYTGINNAADVKKQGLKAQPLQKYWSGPLERFLAAYTTNLNIVFERMFKGFNKGGIVKDLMGVTKLTNQKAKSITQSAVIVNEYIEKFFKSKANGEEFNTDYNNVERGLTAFLMRSIMGSDNEIAIDFNKRKNIIKESIIALEEGNDTEKKKAELYKKAYDKIAKDAKNAKDVRGNVDKTNLEAIEFWHKKWAEKYDDLSFVSEGIYNTLLERDINFSPDRYTNLKGFREKVDFSDNFQSQFNQNNGTLYKKESGSLKKNNRISGIPKDANGNPKSYIDLSFDKVNSTAMYDALMDINTAGTIRQIESFLNSKDFKSIVPKTEDAELLKERIDLYIRNSRNKNIYNSDEFSTITKTLNRIAAIGVSQALAGFTQPLKQVIPVAMNTIMNAGSLNISAMFNSSRNNFMNNSGRSIANRGAESQAQIESINKLIEKASKSNAEKAIGYIEKANRMWLDLFLVKPDIFIARASWMTYYEKSLKQQGIDISGIDYDTHEINDKAADFAQRMVDRQQNISDADLGGKLFTSKNEWMQGVTKMLMPFSSFRMNQSARLGSDIAVITDKTATMEDKKIAAASLSGFGVELITFRIISAAISFYIGSLVMSAMGKDEDEEEKKKRLLSTVKGQFTGSVTDVLSPIPILDKEIQYALKPISEVVSEASGLPLSIYGPMKMDFISNLGTFGIAAQRASQLYDINKLAITGKYTDDYGNQKTISSEDQSTLKWLIVPAVMTNIGLAPSEMNTVLNNAVKYSKKKTQSLEEKEMTMIRKEKKLESISQKEDALMNIMNTSTDQDIINAASEKIDALYSKETAEEKKAKAEESLDKIDLLTDPDTGEQYANETKMKRYNRPLWEQNFGPESDWYKEHEVEDRLNKLLSAEIRSIEDKEYEYTATEKKKSTSKKNSDGTIKRSYGSSYKR